jgi:thiaminase
MSATLTSPPPGAPIQPPPSLTSTLLASSPSQLTFATQHPFLRIAGQGHLPKHTLSRWLSQDRLYAQSYIGFIGSLIARVDLPYVNVSDKSTSLRWRLVDCLTRALQNIHTELAFFATTAQRYGLDLEAAPPRRDGVFTAEPATKQYIDLFRAFWTDPSMSLLEGMVVLWATETVYLRAWTYAASFGTTNATTTGSSQKQGFEDRDRDGDRDRDRDRDRKSKAFSDSVMSELEGSEVNTTLSGTTGIAHEDYIQIQNQTQNQSDNQNDYNSPAHPTDLDGGALRDAFIPNWTSREFEVFVAEIAELTDLLAEREDAVNRKLDVYKAVWRHVLDVERRFWPDVGVSD